MKAARRKIVRAVPSCRLWIPDQEQAAKAARNLKWEQQPAAGSQSIAPRPARLASSGLISKAWACSNEIGIQVWGIAATKLENFLSAKRGVGFLPETA